MPCISIIGGLNERLPNVSTLEPFARAGFGWRFSWCQWSFSLPVGLLDQTGEGKGSAGMILPCTLVLLVSGWSLLIPGTSLHTPASVFRLGAFV